MPRPISMRPGLVAAVALCAASHARAQTAPSGSQPGINSVTPGAATAPPTATPGGSPAAVVPSATATPSTPKPAAAWADTITAGAQFEGGIIVNPDSPRDGENFGDLYTDHSNQFQFNQALFTLTRPTDPNATGYDFGFDLQGLYGSDMRANHYLGQFVHLLDTRYQLGIVQADALVHLPWLTKGGIDVKIGEFPSIMGLEVLDPSANPFYSHSFIYNWGVTFYNTGILTETHVNPTVDVYLGIDTGNTTTFGVYSGDNNARPSGYLGLGLNNLANGKVTVLATASIGPEQPLRVDPNANGDMRYYADILTTWKITDKLTSNTELNYIADDYYRGDGYGFAQYFSYPLSKTVTFNMRGEVWRDGTGDFVANFPANLGPVESALGYATPIIAAPPTTYSELTLGITYKPDMPKPVALFMVRPEIRYERSLNGTTPFDDGGHVDSFLFGGDVVLGF